jgi:hypothetical protein
MVAAAPLFPVHTPSGKEEPRVLLHDVPWATYAVEIISPSRTFADQHAALQVYRQELRSAD